MKTEALEKRIREMDSFDEKLINENRPPLVHEQICLYLERAGMSRSELIKKLNFERTYGYQILNGTRAPTRDHLIRIGLLLNLSLVQLQELLRIGGKEILYVRRMADAKTIYAIEHKLGYEKAIEFIGLPSLKAD